MMTSLAIKACTLGLAQKISPLLSAEWRQLQRIQDHYHLDLDGFYGRLAQDHKPSLAANPWVSFYFYRTGGLNVESARLIETRWKRPSNGYTYNVPTIPYALTDLNISFVSNSAYLLENLEEFVYLRLFPLIGEFLVEFDGDLQTLGPISVAYTFPDISTQYRISPTEYGSLSELAMTLQIRHPIFYIPAEVIKEIREITFSIYDATGTNPVLLERTTLP